MSNDVQPVSGGYDYIQYQEESDGRTRVYLSCHHFMSEYEDPTGKTLTQSYGIGDNVDEIGSYEKAAAVTMLSMVHHDGSTDEDRYYASKRDIALAMSIVDGTRQ